MPENTTKTDWVAIRTEYITTDITQKALAEKYGLLYKTVMEEARKHRWTEERNRHREKIVKSAVKNAEKKKVKSLALYDNAIDKVIRKVDKLIDLAEKPADIKALSGVLKDIRDIKGLKTDLDIKEQKVRIANLEKQLEGERDKEIIVSFSSEAQKYLNQ